MRPYVEGQPSIKGVALSFLRPINSRLRHRSGLVGRHRAIVAPTPAVQAHLNDLAHHAQRVTDGADAAAGTVVPVDGDFNHTIAPLQGNE